MDNYWRKIYYLLNYLYNLCCRKFLRNEKMTSKLFPPLYINLVFFLKIFFNNYFFLNNYFLLILISKEYNICLKLNLLGIGDWGLGIGIRL